MLKSDEYIAHKIRGNDLDLNVLEVGQTNAPTIVLVHGLRDTAHALLPLAKHLSDKNTGTHAYRVLIAELRGHGESDTSSAYSMPNFILDLHTVIQDLVEDNCALFGHSLGGHIVSKYAALFPETIRALIVAEGLGPPQRPHEGDPDKELAVYREMLLTRLGTQPRRSKPIKDLEDVAQRLLKNNPRIQISEARRLAPHMVRSTENGYIWAFDSRASSVFVGAQASEDRRFLQKVRAPTCIISGALSYEYWGREMAQEDFTGHFAEGEIEARAALFQHHEHHWFEQSGHMIHYDEPQRLAELCQQFLEKQYV